MADLSKLPLRELIARAGTCAEALRIRHGDPKPTVAELYDASDALYALIRRIEGMPYG